MPAVLQIETTFNPTQFVLHGVTPTVTIDGVVASRPWGWSSWLLGPGPHAVEVAFPYLGSSSGKASVQITLQEGETRALRYSAPFIVMMAGSLSEAQPVAHAPPPAPPGTALALQAVAPGGAPGMQLAGGPAPYGNHPRTGLPYSDKQKSVAAMLQLFLGGFAVGRFYTGHTGMAIAQIAVTWLTCGFGILWPLIDGIIMLTGEPTDAQGRPLR